MSAYNFVIYGNTVGALVSALELGKKHKVAFVNPTPNWGAHFGGIKINDTNFDIGMIFFEFSTFHTQSDNLLTYDSTHRNDSARFFDIAKKYTAELVKIVDSPTPQCTIFNIFANDIILANDFSVLKMLPAETQNKIREELEQIINSGRGPLHASNKKKDEALFLKTNYRDASIANHGLTFHELFIEPICNKIFNLSASEIPAIYHRIAWAPLFYPETLLKGFEDHTAGLPPTTFEYPSNGYFAKSVEVLTEQVLQNPNITIIRDKVTNLEAGEQYKVNFADTSIEASTLVWCADLQTLTTLTGLEKNTTPFRKGSLALAFLNVDTSHLTKKFSTLYICDINEPIYRITNQDEMGRTGNATSRIIVEYNADQLAKHGITDEQSLTDHTVSALQHMGVIDSEMAIVNISAKFFKNVINLPVAENYETFLGLHNTVIDKLENIELVGMAAGLVTTSFNDQIVHGLRLGAKYN